MDYGLNVSLLKDALAGAGTAHGAIANNIANVNTPEFRRTDVSFKEALAKLEPTPADPNELALATDNARHIPIGGPQEPQPFEITENVDQTTQMRWDRSNVDVDQEMAKLSLNSAYAQTMTQLLQVQYGRLRQAITERTA